MSLPASITVDDLTTDPEADFGPNLTQKIAELAQYRVSRLKAQKWAYQGVKFLVFDESKTGDDATLIYNKTRLNLGPMEQEPLESLETSAPFVQESLRTSFSNVVKQLQQAKRKPLSHSTKKSRMQSAPNEILYVNARNIAKSFEHPEDIDFADATLAQGVAVSCKEDDDSNSSDSILAKGIKMSLEESNGPEANQKAAKDSDDSDSSDAMLAQGIAMSLEEDHIESNKPEADQAASSSCTGPKGKELAGSKEDEECGSCGAFPDFPRHGKVRKFLIAKPSFTCMDFVCVSYCWPKDKDGNPIKQPTTKTITMADGSKRSNKAPDDVLDKAVDIARCYGLRMIWIDQECLPQDTSEEQQLGVQAMDILYARASITAGMLSSTAILTQAHMDAIHIMSCHQVDESGTKCVWRGRGPKPVVGTDQLNLVLDFLEMLTSDAYYTRAWIVQEALSAGVKLCLVLPKPTGVSDRFGVNSYLTQLVGPPARRVHGHRHQSAYIHIPVHVFTKVLAATQFFLEPRLVEQADVTLVTQNGGRPSTNPHREAVRERVGRILPKARSLHPQPPVAVHISATLNAIGSGIDGPKVSCDAATALTLLKSRGCFRAEDRVAILANMCGFEFRLNTFKLAQECPSLRLAIFSQAFLNSDYTIFAPELYRSPRLQMNGLLSPFETQPHTIQAKGIRGMGHINLSGWRGNLSQALSSEGLGIPAYLWKVDRLVDFTPIKVLYGPLWMGLQCLKIESEQASKSEEDMIQHEALLQRLCGQRLTSTIIQLLHKSSQGFDIQMPSKLSDAHCENGMLYLPGGRVSNKVSATRIESDPSMKRVLGGIIFAIIHYLVDNNEIGLANSIWQSLRVDARNEDDSDLPDEAGDARLSPGLVAEDPWSFLRLSHPADGSFQELWLIERIMRDGCVWTGSYVRSQYPGVSPETEEELRRLKKGKNTDTARLGRGNILSRQLRRKMLAIHMQSTSVVNSQNGESLFDRGSAIRFAELSATKTWTMEAEDQRVAELVAAFDVDGPCLIATPFDNNMEMLPRPDVRSMSVCWVVEPLEDMNTGEAEPQEAASPQGKKVSHGVKSGQETEASESSSETAPTHDEVKPTDCDQLGEKQESSNSKAAGAVLLDGKLKVVNKVKGLWQIMDFPSQIYVFR